MSQITSRLPVEIDMPGINALHERTFGPGRYARTAYRIREGTRAISTYCRIALDGDAIIAAIRMTPVLVGQKEGALLLGPLAVDPRRANQGIGVRLITEALSAAKADGLALVILVGDMSYYARFGFKPVPENQMNLPGPYDPERLLACELIDGATAAYHGTVRA